MRRKNAHKFAREGKFLLLSIKIIILIELISSASFRKEPYLIYPDHPSQMKLLWQADGNPGTVTLKWGETPAYGNTLNPAYYGNYQYLVTLTNLTPDYYYYYEISVDSDTETGSFKTAPLQTTPHVVFYAYGDTLSFPSSNNAVLGGLLADLNQNTNERQTLLLHSGDWVSNSDQETYWDTEFFVRSQENIMTALHSIPFMGCRGDHEYTGLLLKKYFPYNDPKCYYSFEYGPVHFIVIDQYESISSGSAQYIWIDNDLATSRKPIKIVLFHEPAWGGGPHGNHYDSQVLHNNIFIKRKVTAVINGHNHNYARCMVDGIPHLTLGGGGAPLDDVDPGMTNYVAGGKIYNFARFVVTNTNQLTVYVYDETNALFDQVTVYGNENGILGETPFPEGDNASLIAVDWLASSSFSASYDGAKAYDGNTATKWTSDGGSPESWLALDLGGEYSITGFVIMHAGAGGEFAFYNTLSYKIEAGSSLSGPWAEITNYTNSHEGASNAFVLSESTNARYLRLYIYDAGIDNYARIPEFQIYSTNAPAIPYIISTDPADNEDHASISLEKIHILFSKPMNAASVLSSVSGDLTITNAEGDNSYDIYLLLGQPVNNQATYYLEIGTNAESSEGIQLSAPYSFSFTIGWDVEVATCDDWTIDESINPAMQYKFKQFSGLFGGKQSLHLLYIDLNNPKSSLSIGHYAPGFLGTSHFGMESLAMGGINGAFFTWDAPVHSVNYLKVNGVKLDNDEVESEDLCAMALCFNSNDASLLPKPNWGNHTYDEIPGYSNIISCGPAIVINGKIADDHISENRDPRTCVGITTNNHLISLANDGRTSESLGLWGTHLAKIMVSLGCHTAYMLDDGGSTTMWLRKENKNGADGVVSYPSDNSLYDHFGERSVASAILFHYYDPILLELKFDDQDNLGVDHSYYANHAAVHNGIISTNGIAGAAAKFDGSDDYMRIDHDTYPGNASLDPDNAITISGWFKTETNEQTDDLADLVSKFDAYKLRLGDNDNPDIGFGIEIWDSSTKYCIYNGVYPETDTWYFVTATYNGSELKLFINASNTTNLTHAGAIDINDNSLNFGWSYGGGNEYNGFMDEIRLYNKALSQEEISNLYNSYTNVPVPPSDMECRVESFSNIFLCWTDNADNEDGFYVYQNSSASKPSLPTITLNQNTTNYNATGLSPATTYHFWIEAYRGPVSSAFIYSNAATSNIQISVIATLPGDGESNVSISLDRIEIYFNYPMDGFSIASNTTIIGDGVTGLDYTSGSGTTNITLAIQGFLNTNNSYTVTVGSNASSTNAMKLDSEYQFIFTTEENELEILDLQILSGDDDIEEQISNGNIYLNSPDLEICYDSFSSINDQHIGLYFQNVSITQGADIINAYLEFTAEEDTASGMQPLIIKAERAGNAAAFSSSVSNLSLRNFTESSVAWNITGNWMDASNYITPNISPVIEEVVNLPTWQSSNAIVFGIQGVLGDTGVRRGYSYEGSNALAPKLHIEYSTSSLPELVLISHSPTNDQPDVWLKNDKIIITYNMNMNGTSVGLSSSIDGPGVSQLNYGSGDNTQTIILLITGALQSQETYTVTVGADTESYSGIKLNEDYIFSFSAEAAPEILSVYPINSTLDNHEQTNIQITFNKCMDFTSITNNVIITNLAGMISGEWSNTDNNIFKFYPQSVFASEEMVCLEIPSTVKDCNSNMLFMSEFSHFRIRDYLSPILISSDPTNNEGSVATDISIQLVFNEMMDTDSVVNNITIKNLTEGGIPVSGNWNIVGNPSFVFTPLSALKTNIQYRIEISAMQVKDDFAYGDNYLSGTNIDFTARDVITSLLSIEPFDEAAWYDGSITIQGTASNSESAPPPDISVSCDSNSYSFIVSNEEWSYTLETTNLTDEEHTLNFRSRSVDGYEDEVPMTVKVDNSAPLVSILDFPVYPISAPFEFKGSISENDSYISSSVLYLISEGTVVSNLQHNLASLWDYTFDSMDYENGNYQLALQAVNAAGVASDPEEVLFSIDISTRIEDIRVENNPYSGEEEGIIFINIHSDVTITIFTLSSEKVIDMDKEISMRIRSWDLHNTEGKRVKPGVYFAYITLGEDTRVIPLIISR
ncbi:Ig-like domain-containing protein [Spirochaetota bacterium]